MLFYSLFGKKVVTYISSEVGRSCKKMGVEGRWVTVSHYESLLIGELHSSLNALLNLPIEILLNLSNVNLGSTSQAK